MQWEEPISISLGLHIEELFELQIILHEEVGSCCVRCCCGLFSVRGRRI